MQLTADVLKKLMAPFPDEAIERTKAAVTRKGYDTTGVKYQYVVNRFNEVLGVGCWRYDASIEVETYKTQKGRDMFAATCDFHLFLGQWVEGKFVIMADAFGTGGHDSSTKADAKKGALTNALKKVAAMFGVGWQAYAGTIDDDHIPHPEGDPDDRPARPLPPAPKVEEPSHKRRVWQRIQQLRTDLGDGEFARLVGCSPAEAEKWKPTSEGEAHTKLARLEAALSERMARSRGATA